MAKPIKKDPFADKVPVRPELSIPPQRTPLQDADRPAEVEVEAAAIPPEPVQDELPLPEDGGSTEDDAGTGKVTRATRVPFGGRKPRLEASTRPGYHRHWFNDLDDRLSRAQGAGYTFVRDGQGRNIQKPGGVVAGSKYDCFLMELPMEWREDDIRAKESKAAEMNEKLVQGTINTETGDGRYVPTEGINIGVTHGPGRG